MNSLIELNLNEIANVSGGAGSKHKQQPAVQSSVWTSSLNYCWNNPGVVIRSAVLLAFPFVLAYFSAVEACKKGPTKVFKKEYLTAFVCWSSTEATFIGAGCLGFGLGFLLG